MPSETRRRTRKHKKGLDVFSIPTQCINLKERPQRWERFRNQGPATHMKDLHRFTAVDGRKLSAKKDRRISMRTRLNILRNQRRSHQEIATLGAIGCSLSHIGIWKKFLASGKPYAMVFEDDAVLLDSTFETIQHQLKNLPDGWGVWLLGAYLPNVIEKSLGNWRQVQNFTASHAQIITREAAKQFLDEVFPIENHIDHQMSAASIVKDVLMVRHPDIQIDWIVVDPKDVSSTVQKHTKKYRCPACKVSDDLSLIQTGAPEGSRMLRRKSISPKHPLRVKGLESARAMSRVTRKRTRKA